MMQDVLVNEVQYFRCSAWGANPAAEIFWFLDNNLIETSINHCLCINATIVQHLYGETSNYTYETISELNVTLTFAEHQGSLLRCSGENMVGELADGLYVNVIG